MYTEHTVVYDTTSGAGARREVTREIFDTPDGRVLGTENEKNFRFLGSNEGWTWVGGVPVSVAFETWVEASEWMNEMFRAHDVWKVAQNGGTKLVIA